MPLTKWHVEPSRLLEHSEATQQGSELTDFINVMMTSLVRQLSCVCRHADDIFSELTAEATLIMLRSKQLNERVTLLYKYTTQISPADEDEGFSLVINTGLHSLASPFFERSSEISIVAMGRSLKRKVLEC